jgi:UDP-N-acetylmuramoyl-tripeptide--D-alanyl-D-alanine ligase
MQLTVAQIAEVTGGRVIVGDGDVRVAGVSTDSRQLEPGHLFVALSGEKVDGHVFVSQVLNGVAAAAVVSQEGNYVCPPDKAVVLVPDTGRSLLKLGAWYRSQFKVSTVAITGSSGKTTVKDLTAQVLSSQFRTLKNRGNLNTEVGVPLTLFNLEPEHEVAVLELAMRGLGQISELAQVTQPLQS